MNCITHKIALILLFSVALFSCNTAKKEEAEEHHDEEENAVELTEAQIKTAGVAFGKVEMKQISGTIRVNGVLDVPPQQLVSVSVPLGGFLKSTDLLQGMHVKKGQLIATVENTEYIQLQQDYLEATNQLEFSKADYERQKELARENVNAAKTLQQAKSTFLTWMAKKNGFEAKLKLLNINLDELEQGRITSTIRIYAPISGYVTEVNVNIGKFVNPTDVLFEIVDTEHLHAELTVFEKDIPKIKIGQKIRFTLANETEERMAKVYLIGREITSDRTVRIHCHIDKEDTDLLPGMYLKAVVETSGASVPALPDEAVVDYQGKKYVFVLGRDDHKEAAQEGEEHQKEGTHFQIVEVQVGVSELGYTEVNLPEGIDTTTVVTKGAYAVLSKLKNSEEEGGHAH